jgi:hypothetical protein
MKGTLAAERPWGSAAVRGERERVAWASGRGGLRAHSQQQQHFDKALQGETAKRLPVPVPVWVHVPCTRRLCEGQSRA